jgi:hypothetical protein
VPDVTSSPYNGHGAEPDGSFRGTSVWWSPRLRQEPTLPAYAGSPLPATIDVTDVGRAVSPLASARGRALAAFAVLGDAPDRVPSVGVVGVDGRVRLVDTGQVQPMTDPEGNSRVDVGSSMLSPSGTYLMFPQQRSVLVLTLATGKWRTIHTGAHDTWDATWTSNTAFVLKDPARPQALGPRYDVSGDRVAAARDWSSVFQGAAYGLARRGPDGSLAQAYVAGEDVPQPPALHLSPAQSDWIGVASAPDAILVVGQEPGRQKQCCPVASWLDADTLMYESRSSGDTRLLAWKVRTGGFSQVATIVGLPPGTSLVSSYSRLGR